MPHAADALTVAVPAGRTRDLAGPREGRHGGRLVPAVRAAADRSSTGAAAEPVDPPEPDVDIEVLWEVPEQPAAGGRTPGWPARPR